MRTRGIRVGRAAVVAAVVVLAAPAAAGASGFRQFVVGPVAVGHGYSVVAFKDGCYAGPPNLLNPPPPDFGENGVELIKSIPGGTETHTYSSGRPATCDLTTGTFKLNLGRLATIDVTFHPRGNSWKGSLSSGNAGRHWGAGPQLFEYPPG